MLIFINSIDFDSFIVWSNEEKRVDTTIAISPRAIMTSINESGVFLITLRILFERSARKFPDHLASFLRVFESAFYRDYALLLKPNSYYQYVEAF